MLSTGADVFHVDNEGYTALDYALVLNNSEIIEILSIHTNYTNIEYRQPIKSEKQVQELPPDDHLDEDLTTISFPINLN